MYKMISLIFIIMLISCGNVVFAGEHLLINKEGQVTATDLRAFYANNEIKADNFFKGKTLVVKGKIAEIRKGCLLDDCVVISLAAGNGYVVTCTLAKAAENEAVNKNPGETVALQGIGAGMTIGSPMVNNCVFVPMKKATKKGKPSN